MKNGKPSYRGLVWPAMAMQAVLAFFAGSVLDGGYLAASTACAAIAFWSIAIWIILKRPDSPTKSDRFFFRVGVPGFTLGSWFVLPWVWSV
jgi:hypothetical protein